MPQPSTGTYTDALLFRATLAEPEPLKPEVVRHLQMAGYTPPPPVRFDDLPTLSERLLALHELVRFAKEIPDPRSTAPPNISEEGWRFLEAQGSLRYRGRGYEVISLEMRSPLTVVLQIPPAAVAAFGFALLALAERVATAGTRVSKKRAKDLRDRAALDRERSLIESGRLEMAIQLLRRHPKPDVIEIVGGDENFDEAEPVEQEQLQLPEDDDVDTDIEP